MNELPPFMLIPDDNPDVTQVYGSGNGVAQFKGRIWFTNTHPYGNGWIAEIVGREDDPEHFSDTYCHRGGRVTALSRLLTASPSRITT